MVKHGTSSRKTNAMMHPRRVPGNINEQTAVEEARVSEKLERLWPVSGGQPVVAMADPELPSFKRGYKSGFLKNNYIS